MHIATTIFVIVALVALCLWLFFRPGSISDRADVDVPLSDDDSSVDAIDDVPLEGS
ncbi:MAG: hypothetical protein WCK41_11115 [Actinomycetes bacterium]